MKEKSQREKFDAHIFQIEKSKTGKVGKCFVSSASRNTRKIRKKIREEKKKLKTFDEIIRQVLKEVQNDKKKSDEQQAISERQEKKKRGSL